MLPQLTHKTDPKGFSYFEQLLAPANITLNGANSSDIKVSNERLFRRVLRDGTLGLGEAYMDGWWDCEQLDELVCRTLRSGLHHSIRNNWRFVVFSIFCRLFNLQSVQRAFMVGEKHYDIGNDVFEAMLDTHMNYSCGYWASARNLGEAQEHKMEMICRKLQLEPGMRVLDVGCGWGGLSWWMAERHGVEVTGITVSKEQAELAQNRCRDLPVTIELIDYRSLSGCYDRIVSVGMFEHVGRKNYREYMKVANRCLKDDGLFLLHTIGKNVRNTSPDPWIDKYIFPNGELPALSQVTNAAESLFVVEDVHNFGADYDRTLMAWYKNFEASWPQFKDQFSERFYRMWRYYLLSCAGAFRARDIQLWQFVLSKKGVLSGYDRVS